MTETPPTIGVFDSGFGGLTVLRALIPRLPRARFAFIGDTARLPYGSKSRRTIARYAVESAQFLVREQGAEFIVIACNTASALALDAIQEAVPVPVLGVIEPGATAARAASTTGDVLVMATHATVQSHAYKAACATQKLRAFEKACPLLVPLVEEGWVNHHVTDEVIRIYLDELLTDARADTLKPDTLVLGCTHYPLLRQNIERAVPQGMKVIDSAESTAEAAARLFNGRAKPRHTDETGCPILTESELADSVRVGSGPTAATKAEIRGCPIQPSDAQASGDWVGSDTPETQIRCFATDSVEKFERLGSRFLGRPTGPVQLVDLGG